MIGMVLAAGAGRRLAPYTDTLPKTLVPVDGDRTILDIALANLAKAAGLDDVVVVTGYAAAAVEERKAALEDRHGVRLELVFNDKAEEWNNAYSLWCARDLLRPRRAARQRRHRAPAERRDHAARQPRARRSCSRSTTSSRSARRR